MSDDTQIILKTFQDYGKKFEELKPSRVLPYFHYPSVLISPNKEAAITNWFTGFFTFTLVMSDLKQRGYSHGEMPSLSVRRLSDNLAIVSGVVIRYKKDRTELERFGLV